MEVDHQPPDRDHDASKRARLSGTLGLTLSKSRQGVLTTPTFSEAIDPGMCKRMIDAGVLYRTHDGGWMEQEYGCNEEQQVRKIAKATRNGVLRVRYKSPKCGFGRVNPKGSLSLGSLRKEVRHTLCGGDWLDLDVANCHPTILLQLCRDNGIVCAALAHYVSHREDCLAEVAALFKEDQGTDAAKILFIRVMYGGSASKWRQEHKDALIDDPVIPPSVLNLQREVGTISRALQAFNPEMVKAVEALHKKSGKTHNFDGSFLSYYAQEWERRVLECVFTMLKSRGCIGEDFDCVLCFDGIMVRRERCADAGAVVQECEEAVRGTLGLDLTFTEKPMAKSLLPQIEAAEQTQRGVVFPADKLLFLDTAYANALPSYALKKRYVETFVVKAMLPDPLFVWTDTRVETDEHGVECTRHVSHSYDEARLAKALRHLRCGNAAFTDAWFKDPEIRVYNRVDFMPYNGVFDPAQHDRRCYNLFKGYSPHIQAPLPSSIKDEKAYRERMLRPFFDLGRELFEGKERFLDFFLKCIAFVLQNPRQKHPYCFILTGNQGTGKTMFLDAIGRLVGHTHYYSTTNPNDLFGTHAEGFVHKIFVVMNECEGKDTFMIEGKLKGAVTEVYMTVNAKNQRPVRMKNLAFIIIASNKPNPVQIDVRTADRRFLCAKSTEVYLGKFYNERFWTRLAAHLRTPEFIRCLYDHLAGMEVAGVDWKRERKANLGKAYQELAALYSPIEAVFFEEMAQKIRCQEWDWPYMPRPLPSTEAMGWGIETRFKKSELYTRMKAWAKDHGYYQKMEPNPKQFYNRLTAGLNFPIRSGAPYNGEACYFCVPETVHKHLVRNKWVEEGAERPDEPQSTEAFCKAFVDDLVDRVCTKAEQDALFSMNDLMVSPMPPPRKQRTVKLASSRTNRRIHGHRVEDLI